jgi:hypothetical protein
MKYFVKLEKGQFSVTAREGSRSGSVHVLQLLSNWRHFKSTVKTLTVYICLDAFSTLHIKYAMKHSAVNFVF